MIRKKVLEMQILEGGRPQRWAPQLAQGALAGRLVLGLRFGDLKKRERPLKAPKRRHSP